MSSLDDVKDIVIIGGVAYLAYHFFIKPNSVVKEGVGAVYSAGANVGKQLGFLQSNIQKDFFLTELKAKHAIEDIYQAGQKTGNVVYQAGYKTGENLGKIQSNIQKDFFLAERYAAMPLNVETATNIAKNAGLGFINDITGKQVFQTLEKSNIVDSLLGGFSVASGLSRVLFPLKLAYKTAINFVKVN